MGVLDDVYREAHADLAKRARPPIPSVDCRVRVVPYAGLRSTIFRRPGHYEIRIGDLLMTAPLRVHHALSCLLLGRIDRRLRPRPGDLEPYRQWSRSREVVQAHERLRRERGRKRMAPAEGRVHNLRTLFDRLNLEFFQGALPPLRVGWSPRVSRRLYGHHDAAHDAIVINRLLDHPRVPEAVVADILHHEMLHVKHGIAVRPNGRRVLHSHAFKQDERGFPNHEEARRFLKDLEARRVRLKSAPSPSQMFVVSRIRALLRPRA